MSIVQELGARAEAIDSRAKANDFISLQRGLLAAGGDWQLAIAQAPQLRTSAGAVNILKSAVSAGSTTTLSTLNDYKVAVGGFLSSMRGHSVFDSILPSCLQLPLHTRIAVTTSAITATRLGELSAKPISRLSLESATLEPIKTAAEVVLTQELVRSSRPESAAVIARELRQGLATATDAAFFALVVDDITPIPSSGGNVLAVRSDLSTALDALSTGANSKIYFIVSSSVAKRLALMGDANGGSAFPNMTPSGGVIGGVPTLVSDGLAIGTLVALDAAQIATGSDELEARTAEHATIQLDDAPDSPPIATTKVTSLWQHNLIAMRLERFFGVQRLRADAVSVISGVNYSGNSPA